VATIEELDRRRLPRHVAIVMDGNGRWAQRRGLPRTEGHAAGEEALMDTIWGADDIGIKWLTVYAFSTENWKRPVDEVRYLMNFNERLLLTRRDEIHARGIRMQFLGRRDWRVPRRILRRIDETLELTRHNTGMVLSMAFNYGGRAELVDAVRAIVEARIPADKISEKTIARHLYDPSMPDPELVVRTSGEVRTSNFLMWEAAYSELVFTDTLWPDFRTADLYGAILEFQQRDRRFGGLNEG
jgi:undecaprenyl diphosphate synthase